MEEAKFKESNDVREFERFVIRLTVKFIDLDKNKGGTGYTHDISAKGIGLITRENLCHKTPMDLYLYMPDHHEPLSIKGEVVWSKPIDPNSWRIGINLDQTDLIGISRIFRVH